MINALIEKKLFGPYRRKKNKETRKKTNRIIKLDSENSNATRSNYKMTSTHEIFRILPVFSQFL